MIAKSEKYGFHFETHNVRLLVDEHNKPWFVAKDVAEVLRYVKTADAVRKHCKGVSEMETPSAGGLQMTKIIGRDDIIRLVMKSKLPAAQKFEQWVSLSWIAMTPLTETTVVTGSQNLLYAI